DAIRFFFSSRRRHTSCYRDWSSDVCSSDLFIVIAPQTPYSGSQVWGSDFLPAIHQGTRIVPGPEPIPDLKPRAPSPEIQEMELRSEERRVGKECKARRTTEGANRMRQR